MTTKTGFTSVTNDKYYSVSSSKDASVGFTATDETKMAAGLISISNITIAKKMVFELPGFTDLTGPYNQAVIHVKTFGASLRQVLPGHLHLAPLRVKLIK
ncbi:MAG: hypothetical protein CM15mP109_15440 [Candidatus Dadabacteria bacterium]|nr:MAG: hypothetical protein CM15mP109_15440 [Candidatus Dadabacteria bacterium]